MQQSLTVRSYKPTKLTHSHNHHQVVVPLQGELNITLAGMRGPLLVGQGVVIERNVQHSFSAKEDARFLVADLKDLPIQEYSLTNPVKSLSKTFKSFCHFVEMQQGTTSAIHLQHDMISIFKHLLLDHDFQQHIDRRIFKALALIECDISQEYTLAELSRVSSLSVSHFKVILTRCMGITAEKYILKLRMEKAREFLLTTNMPISLIAENTGYEDQSAFSRRFKIFFGMSPSRYRRQRNYN